MYHVDNILVSHILFSINLVATLIAPCILLKFNNTPVTLQCYDCASLCLKWLHPLSFHIQLTSFKSFQFTVLYTLEWGTYNFMGNTLYPVG